MERLRKRGRRSRRTASADAPRANSTRKLVANPPRARLGRFRIALVFRRLVVPTQRGAVVAVRRQPVTVANEAPTELGLETPLESFELDRNFYMTVAEPARGDE